MAEDDDDKRAAEALADFLAARPFRELRARLDARTPPSPRVPSARTPEAKARRQKALAKANQRWQSTPVIMTVADLLLAIEACDLAAEYAEARRTIEEQADRLRRAEAAWRGIEDTNTRARKVCAVLFGSQRGRRAIDRKAIRYAWDDITTGRSGRHVADDRVGEWWQRMTWAGLGAEAPDGASADETITVSLRRLPVRERRKHAVRVIRRLWELPSEDATVKALARAGVKGLPAVRRR